MTSLYKYHMLTYNATHLLLSRCVRSFSLQNDNIGMCLLLFSSHMIVMCLSEQIGKLHNHLRLLREQYVNLQNCYSQLERRHQSVLSTSTASDASSSECFVTNLLDIVSNLYDKEEYRWTWITVLAFIVICLFLFGLVDVSVWSMYGTLGAIGAYWPCCKNVSGYRGWRFEPRHQYAVSFRKTLSALLQLSQLWN